MGTIVCNKVDASVGFVLCGVAMAHLYMWPPIYLESQFATNQGKYFDKSDVYSGRLFVMIRKKKHYRIGMVPFLF